MRHSIPSLLAVFIALCGPGFSAEARKKIKNRTWSLSITNGYTFYNLKEKNSPDASTEPSGYDGQMNTVFSSLEISRNFGYYEVGGKLQLFDHTFISPFFKINFRRNHKRARFIPLSDFWDCPLPSLGRICQNRLQLVFKLPPQFSPLYRGLWMAQKQTQQTLH